MEKSQNSVSEPSRGTFAERSFASGTLRSELDYCVYLPNGYEHTNQTYPVIYLLHGAKGTHLTFQQEGEIAARLDRWIQEQVICPFIAFFPNGAVPDGTKSFYVNSSTSQFNWETMFIEEFIAVVESQYRCDGSRYIGGLSMGGYGAFYYSTKYPHLFDAAFSISGAFLNDEVLKNMPQEMYDTYFGNLVGFGLVGEARLNDRYREYNIADRFKRFNAAAHDVRFYFDCGDNDMVGTITVTNAELHIQFIEQGIDHEYRVQNGRHGWEYWNKRLPEAIRFINDIENSREAPQQNVNKN